MALPADEDAIVKSRAVIVIGPPWVRSGTGRVMQNQIAYYRQRGYLTVFLGVAVDSLHVRSCWVWDVFAQGAPELGAEHVSSAVLEPLRRRDRYARHIGGLLRHRLRGTALNGIVDVARTAKLPDEFSQFSGQPRRRAHPRQSRIHIGLRAALAPPVVPQWPPGAYDC